MVCGVLVQKGYLNGWLIVNACNMGKNWTNGIVVGLRHEIWKCRDVSLELDGSIGIKEVVLVFHEMILWFGMSYGPYVAAGFEVAKEHE